MNLVSITCGSTLSVKYAMNTCSIANQKLAYQLYNVGTVASIDPQWRKVNRKR
jgi:hypothetical protein